MTAAEIIDHQKALVKRFEATYAWLTARCAAAEKAINEARGGYGTAARERRWTRYDAAFSEQMVCYEELAEERRKLNYFLSLKNPVAHRCDGLIEGHSTKDKEDV